MSWSMTQPPPSFQRHPTELARALVSGARAESVLRSIDNVLLVWQAPTAVDVRWMILHSVGLPSGRVLLVPGVSECTRRNASAPDYRPDLNRAEQIPSGSIQSASIRDVTPFSTR